MPKARSKHARIPHLELRPQGYVWRRRIPRSILRLNQIADSPLSTKFTPDRVKPTQTECGLRRAIAHSEGLSNLQEENSGIQTVDSQISICLALKTHAFPEAADLARKLSAISDQIFLYAATSMSLSPQDTTTLLTAFARFEIEAGDRERALADPRSPQLAQAALEREAARQAVLRQAFFQHDYSIVQEPLRHVANHLGIKLPDAASEQARLLAYEATRVMLDASQEKVRRDRGEFPGPSPYFSSVIVEQSNPGTSVQTPPTVMPFAPIEKEEAMKPVPQSRFASSEATAVSPSVSDQVPAPSERTKKKEIHDLLRRRGVFLSCTPEMLAMLEKGNEITVAEAFSVYIALKKAGFGEEWHKHQKPDAAAGEGWARSSLSALKTGAKMWGQEMGSCQISGVSFEIVEETIKLIRKIIALHGKGPKNTAATYRELVIRVEVREVRAMDEAERALRQQGCTNEATIRDARLAKMEPRLRAETFMRNVRSVNRAVSMLKELGIVDCNPFNICTFSTREQKALKMTEANIARQPWDDRIDNLLATRVFQGNAADEADPLFWMPLIAYLMGARMEEAAQAGPDDVQRDEGIAYLIIRQVLGDSVKSENATRKIPVHPVLIELGFLELVERAKKRGDRRLFSSLTRGANKGTYTENFTKAFGYYRRTNDVYWHGLDFHALRTTFHHRLADAACPGAHRRKLMGHEPLDEGERAYAQKGISIASLFEQVKKIPFDSTRVQSPISGYPKASHEGKGLRLVHRSAS